MQPNNQQGYYRPDQNQPQPTAPPQPSRPLQPLSPIGQPTPTIDPAELNAALAEPQAAPVPALVPAQQQQPAPQAPAQAVAPPQPVVAPGPQPQAAPAPAQPEYTDEQADDEPLSDEDAVTWTAHEYIHQEKGTLWFIIFAVVILAFIAVSILTKAYSFTAVILVIAVVVVIYSRRPPRELSYSLTDEGLVIDNELHAFSSFKSFGVIRDGDEFSVMLIPTRRFQPGTTVYFPEEYGEDIVDMLGARMPMRDLKLDIVDRVVRLLRL